jgi:hypothetical protein
MMKRLFYIFLTIALMALGWEMWGVDRRANEKNSLNLMTCRSQLGAIYLDLKAYADHNGRKFPAELSDLVREGYERQDIFVCPNSNDDYIEPGTPAAKMAADMDGPNRGSYEYYGVNLTESSPPESVLIAERPENHAPLGGHVLYLSGKIAFLGPKDLQEVRGLLQLRKTSVSTTEP